MGTDTTTAPEADELGITELLEFDPTRLDGVKSAATGIPFLLMKSAAPQAPPAVREAPEWLTELAKAIVRGKVDEAPDIELGNQIMSLLGKAIGNEADELAAGNYGEARDVAMLSDAAAIIKCWIAREQAVAAGQDPDSAGLLMCSVALPAGVTAGDVTELVKAAESTAKINDLPDSAFAYIEDGGSKDGDGKTTPRSKRHFPVHDEEHARNALTRLSSSPFGDKAKGKVRAAAKKFGIDTGDTSKSAVAEGGSAVQTEPQGVGALTKSDLDAAVTKATEAALGRLAAKETQLDTLLAKVKATPIPGGPVLSGAAHQIKGSDDGNDWAAKAAYYREMAETISDRQAADGYRKLAREASEKATAPAAS